VPWPAFVIRYDPALLVEAVKCGGQVLSIIRQMVGLEVNCHPLYYLGQSYQAAN